MKKDTKFITINTDAGISSQGISAFAYWIKSDYETIKSSGKFKNTLIDINEGEIKSILNALTRVTRLNYFNQIDVIVINTDSKNAINHLIRPNGSVKYKEAVDYYNQITKEIHCEIKFRHVRSHSNGKKARDWVNNWCDKQCRKHYK